MCDPRIVAALAGFDLEEIPSSPRTEEGRFANVDVLFIQHHLGPFIPKLKAFFSDFGIQ